METNKNKRYSQWDIITYAKGEEFQQVLDEIGVRYAYITHDSDVKEDGEMKEVHTHILMTVKSAMTFTALMRYFERISSQNTRAIGITASYVRNRYEYLTHKNDKDKHQYSEEDIVTNDRAYYERLQRGYGATQDDTTEEFMADLLGDTISIREMALKYGRDFIKNLDKYMKFRRLALEEFEELVSDNKLTKGEQE